MAAGIAFLSDRATPGHQLPYTTTLDGRPVLAAELTGSAEAVAWSSDGTRLLVMAADAGLYGLDFSARAVLWSEHTGLEVRRPNESWRRLFSVDLESDAVEEVGPPDHSVWEFDLLGDSTVVAIVSDAPSGYGWYHSRLVVDRPPSRTARTLYQPTWHLEGLTVSPDARRAAVVEGYSSDPGLLSGSIKVIDLDDGSVADPWPGLETRRSGVLVRRRLPLVRADRRPRDRRGPGLAGRPPRRGLVRARVHRRERRQATVRGERRRGHGPHHP